MVYKAKALKTLRLVYYLRSWDPRTNEVLFTIAPLRMPNEKGHIIEHIGVITIDAVHMTSFTDDLRLLYFRSFVKLEHISTKVEGLDRYWSQRLLPPKGVEQIERVYWSRRTRMKTNEPNLI